MSTIRANEKTREQKAAEEKAMLEKLAELVSKTSEFGEKMVSNLIDRHLDRAAISVNIKARAARARQFIVLFSSAPTLRA